VSLPFFGDSTVARGALHYIFGRSRHKERASARFLSQRGRRLVFEPLEDRQMLASITVTSLADNLNVDGQVTLREAIQAAELDIKVDGSTAGSGADTIQFAAGLSGVVNLLLVGDVAAGPSALAVTSDVRIRGNTAGITIERSNIGAEMRLFRVAPGGSLTLENITLAGGIARGRPGISPDGAGGEGRGGAILNQGTLRVTANAIAGNEALGGAGVGSGSGGVANGGAIYNDGGTTTIVNTTLSGNSARSGTGSGSPPSFGGAVYSRNGTLQIYNSTITSNISVAARGVFAVGQAGSADVEIYSSIIGQADAAPTIYDFTTGTDEGGTLSVAGANNIIRRQNDFLQITISNDDPLLAPLANNGGSTRTHALMDGSPAIDRGSNPFSLSTDQRGPSHPRVSGGQADIGAFEVQAAAGPALPGDYNGNHVVDAADYVIWRKMLGAEVPRYTGADGSGNSSIDAEDHGVWRANFGKTLPAAAAAALPPEVALRPPADRIDVVALIPHRANDFEIPRRPGSEAATRPGAVSANLKHTMLSINHLIATAARSSTAPAFLEPMAAAEANEFDAEALTRGFIGDRSNRGLLNRLSAEWASAFGAS
jgi:CSLREA domain-containing protein